MNELTIVQHNDLVESSYRLEIDEIRLLNLAFTKIDSRKASPGTVEIYPDEFSKMYNLQKKNIWRNMKKSRNNLMQKPVRIKFTDENGEKKEKLVFWVSSAEYYANQSDGNKILLKFTNDIIPYLFELEKRFTKINFKYVNNLSTPFSIRLYQWLIQNCINKHQIIYKLTLSLQTIKERANYSADSYPNWRDFKSRIIQPAIDAINWSTNLSVTYETLVRGKKVYALTFTYIDDKQKSGAWPMKKPIRPRLLRRPKVKGGSHAEGEWKRKNLQLLTQYQKDLKAWDPTAKLKIEDLRRIVSYSKLFNPTLHKKMYDELLIRQKPHCLSKTDCKN